MTTQKKVIVVNSNHGDWSGIYLDNELWTEHHSLHTQDWAELINNHHLESVDVKEVDGEWLGWLYPLARRGVSTGSLKLSTGLNMLMM